MRTSSVDKVIIEILSREHAHLTALQLFEEIRLRIPAVNQSTIYRALDRLVKLGKVSISDMGAGAAVFELLGEGLHHHLVCKKCGTKITIGNQEIKDFFLTIQRENNFRVDTNHLILFGYCKNCQAEVEMDSSQSKEANIEVFLSTQHKQAVNVACILLQLLPALSSPDSLQSL